MYENNYSSILFNKTKNEKMFNKSKMEYYKNLINLK